MRKRVKSNKVAKKTINPNPKKPGSGAAPQERFDYKKAWEIHGKIRMIMGQVLQLHAAANLDDLQNGSNIYLAKMEALQKAYNAAVIDLSTELQKRKTSTSKSLTN